MIDKPTLYVFNKIDLLNEENHEYRSNYTFDGMNEHDKNVFISAEKRQNVTELRKKIYEMIKVRHFQIFPNYVINEHINGEKFRL